MNAGRQRTHGPDGRKERDDDLVLFRELFKREEQRNVSLLQHESDDFETASGNYPLYRMPSVKKGAGYDFLAVDSEKNDYDWLKTPPGTPLFPSLEMESKAPNMVLYNEIPILQPLKTSRFAGKPEGPKPGHRPKSSGSRSTASTYSDSSSSRSVTPNKRPISSSGKSTTPTATTLKEALNLKQRPKQSISSYTKQSNLTVATRAAAARPSSGGSTTTTPKKQSTDTKPLSRGVSPFVRTRVPATLPGFSDETPPNLITSSIPVRALSASRCRPGNPVPEPKAEAGKPRRQSCSPSVNRGRKVAEVSRADGERATAAATGGNLLVGSRMVEKLMNARRSDAVGEEKRDLKTKLRVAAAAAKQGAGFGRLMSRASLDVALKHMEIRKLPSDNQQNTGRAKGSSLTSSIRSTGGDDTPRNLWGRRSSESR